VTYWVGKSVLITGGAGFIGHHLTTALLAGGASVHVIDNFSTGHHANLDMLACQLSVQRHDLCIPIELPPCDIIYNLASPASPLHYQADPIGTWKSNVLGTLHLLEHAQHLNAIFVQASTSEVYGDPATHPQTETDWGNVNPIGPRACYDESKRAAEALLMDAVRVANSDVRIARIFNTYGSGMNVNDGRAIPNFIAQAQAGQPLTIFGNGTQTRSFCYIGDTVSGLLRLAEKPQARGEVINIGNPHEVSVLDVARKINLLWGNDAGITFAPGLVDDPVRRCPNIAKARQLLDWAPKVTLDEGLSHLR
jgi:UDP-glucuronate decarboxylase